MLVKHYKIRMLQFELVKDQSGHTGLRNSVFAICTEQFQLLICIQSVNEYQSNCGH